MMQSIKSFKEHYILFGLPCSGKGVHSTIIKGLAIDQLQTIEMGEMFRQEIKNQTEMGTSIKEQYEHGDLLPDECAFKIMSKHSFRKSTLFDGFPRTIGQAKDYVHRINFMKEQRGYLINPMIINISAADPKNLNGFIDTLLLRMSGRISKAIQNNEQIRPDDQIDILQRRIDLALTETLPAMGYMKAKGIPVLNVNGETDILNPDNTKEYANRIFEISKFLSKSRKDFIEKNWKYIQQMTR